MKFFLYIILSFAVVPLGNAQEQSASQENTVEAVVRMALTNNLQLQAARFTIFEAQARASAAGRLSNPELESSFAPNISGGERTFTIGFSQRLPVTSRLRIEKRISNLQLNLARAEIAEFERSLAFQVRTTAVALATIAAQQHLNEKQRLNSRALLDAVRRSVQSVEISAIDFAQLELEESRLNLRHVQLQFQRSESLNELGLLSNSNISSNLDLSFPPVSNPAPNGNISDQRSDLQLARYRSESARQNVSLARAQRWQDIQVGAFTEIDRNEDAPNGLETDHIVGLRVAIPLPLWNNGKARIAEAAAAEARTERQETALLARINTEVASAATHLSGATEQLNVLRQDLLPKARNIEERLAAAQAQGLSTLLEVVRARERRFELESAELDALRDLHLAHARYLYVTGTTLIER